MGLVKSVKKYRAYEAKELARRIDKKRKLKVYGSLAKKKKKLPSIKIGKFDKKKYNKAIGNPYKI